MKSPSKFDASAGVLREVAGLLSEIRKDRRDVERELQEQSEGGERLLSCLVPWFGLYSFPMEVHVCAFFDLLGWGDRLREASQAPNRIEAHIDLCRSALGGELDEEAGKQLDSFNDSQLGIFLAVFFAMTNNAAGIQKYGESVSDLVFKAENDDEALLKAVAVDRSVVAHPIIAKRITIAQLKDDRSFMDRLSKAVTRTKPGRKMELDDFRYIVEVLDEVEGLTNLTI